MKKLMLFVMLLAFAVISQAQTSLVATLSHDGLVTTFYSANGLKEAHAAAVDGDIITLSSGSFLATDITKNLTIRGAGMDIQNNPTIINGDFVIQCTPNNESDTRLTLEGVYMYGTVDLNKQADNVSFIKSWFKLCKLYSNSPDSSLSNEVFINCIINTLHMDTYGGGSLLTATFINSIITELKSCYPTSASFTNCFINANTTSVYGCTFANCILKYNSSIDSSSNAINCYCQGTNANVFENMTSKSNHYVDESVTIFKDEETYELSDELVSTWLGTDGTQVGIYGGTMPFDPTPSNPRITKFNVAPKTTADGKLSVEIEVKAN